MRKAILLFGLFWLAFSESGRAQQIDMMVQDSVPVLYRNGFYLELGGNAGFASFNYERLEPFRPGETLVLRIGGFFIPYNGTGAGTESEFIVPFEVGVLRGKKALKLEVAFGGTLHHYNQWYQDGSGTRRRNIVSHVSTILRIGARWQKPENDWFVRVGVMPMADKFLSTKGLPAFGHAGISLGYSFNWH